ncbi:MAG: hypothetical protein EXS35_05335 [Pedosphaera sp.]|nr:hypothetical protein [Pedosphaera sp.]
MEDDARVSGPVKVGMGAVGLGAVASFFVFPGKVGIIVGVSILVLFLLCFGGYYLWRRYQAKSQSKRFTSALEAQTSAAPKSISDPNKRAALDKLRQKFQTGLTQFKSRDKDIYKLPWYIIIGEPGSGKSEAIRHSGIDFPPGLQDEMQGSGGTVNMDWWFTNRGIILDTAGSMIFGEAGSGDAPEWKEFLRLLKKTRPHCPVNGLFLVLSVESLIKDSADTIARKSSKLAQQLDLIQRALDVRFPVYLLVTKCDLLIGFREFFDSNDPDFQYQMFGWSNPDPLDSHFRPDLVETHLKSVAERLRRRRMALLRETATAGRLGDTQHFFASSYQLGGAPAAAPRKLDEVDSLFALPESVMRLAPRLRRYLETVFVAGEWSAKPVFLRGIYFTSSMREGKALDEAIALATGLGLDQLPEERSWEKNRAFFLRDLFLEKVFRESGLVTRATNTLKMLRSRQLLIFGTAGAALLLLLGFATYGYFGLKKSVLNESGYWQAGAANWKQGEWSPGIVRPGEGADVFRFGYSGTNIVEVADNPTVLEFHSRLKKKIEGGFSVPFIFKPAVWIGMGEVKNRDDAQRVLFERGVLTPLIGASRRKMIEVAPRNDDPASLRRHRDALLSLVQIEAELANRKPGEGLSGGTNGMERAGKYLNTFVSYLTDSEFKGDTNLTSVFAWTYLTNKAGLNKWAPVYFSGGDRLSNNIAIRTGLQRFRDANRTNEVRVQKELANVNQLVTALLRFRDSESAWLSSAGNSCVALTADVVPAKAAVDDAWNELSKNSYFGPGTTTNLNARYRLLEDAAQGAARTSMNEITSGLGVGAQMSGIIAEVSSALTSFGQEAAQAVRTNRAAASNVVAELDLNFVTPARAVPLYQARWALYTNACALRDAQVGVSEAVIGNQWRDFLDRLASADQFVAGLTNYTGPFAPTVATVCDGIAGAAVKELKARFVADYVKEAARQLTRTTERSTWTIGDITNSRSLFERIQRDLDAREKLGGEAAQLEAVKSKLAQTRRAVLTGTAAYINGRIGFPVRLKDTVAVMNPGDLKALSGLLANLAQELGNPIWQADADAVRKLKDDSASYASVVSALVDKDGNPVEWELAFIPPEVNSDDHRMITVYPYAQVSFGGERTAWKDVSHESKAISFGTNGVQQKVEIAFRKFADDAKSQVTPLPGQSDWGLLHVIQAGNCTRSEDGRTWRFKVRLEDKTQSLAGFAVFEARLLARMGLPKVEDWPK